MKTIEMETEFIPTDNISYYIYDMEDIVKELRKDLQEIQQIRPKLNPQQKEELLGYISIPKDTLEILKNFRKAIGDYKEELSKVLST